MKRVTAEQFASNSMWKLIEVASRSLVSLVISVVLARLLLPESYGVIAIITVFITFSNIFIQSGFNVALIRKDEVQSIDYSTVTVLGFAFSILLYTVFFFAAPIIASFFEAPDLEPTLRVMLLLIIFQSNTAVIRAKGTRELQFKKMSFSSFLSSFLGGVIGVAMAYLGYGVWALVAQQLLASVIDLLLMIVLFHWRPSFRFSPSVAREMCQFTFGVIGSSFLDFLGNNVVSLVIGKCYSSVELGLYNRGYAYPETISLNIYNSITSVLLPALASRQDDQAAFLAVLRKVTSMTTYIIFPLMFGLAAISDTFVEVILTEKWAPCIPILICACICYAINPVRSIGYYAFYAQGESARTFRVELCRCILMLLSVFVLAIILNCSVYVLAVSNAVVAFIVALYTCFQMKSMVGYKLVDVWADIKEGVYLSTAVAVVCRLVTLIPVTSVLTLCIQLFAGISVYMLLSILVKNSNWLLLVDLAKKKVLGKNGGGN